MPRTAPKRRPGTAQRILDVAERLVQTRGFNAFSYADVAEELGVRKASLHHHFATKAELGLAVVARYRERFLESLAGIESEVPGARERLARYAELYGAVLRRKRMCLCGMMAADVVTLPRPLRQSLAEYFSDNAAWLERILEAGKARGEVRFGGSAASMAAFIVGSLEGAMLLARGSGRVEEFEDAAAHLLALIEPPAKRASRA